VHPFQVLGGQPHPVQVTSALDPFVEVPPNLSERGVRVDGPEPVVELVHPELTRLDAGTVQEGVRSWFHRVYAEQRA